MMMRTMLFCMVLMFSPSVLSQSLPDIEFIDSEITRLKAEEPKDDNLLGQYQTLAQEIKSQQNLRKEQNQLRDLIAQFPTRRELLNQKIKDVEQLPLFQIQQLDTYNDASQALARLAAALSEWRATSKANAEKRKQLNDSRTNLPKELASLTTQIDQASLAISQEKGQLQQWLMVANLDSLKLEKEKRLLEQQTLDERSELLRLEQELLDRKIQIAVAVQIEIQNRLTAIEQGSVKILIQQAELLANLYGNRSPELDKNIGQAQRLAKELEKVLLDIDFARIETHKVEVDRQNLAGEQLLIRNNLDWLRGSTAFGASIRAQLQRLPVRESADKIADNIAHAHIRKYEISQLRAQLAIEEAMLTKNVHDVDNEQQPEYKVKQFNSQLLTRLGQEYDKLITGLSRLQAVNIQYQDEVSKARVFLREQQLWIRSNQPLWHNITRFEVGVWFGASTPLKILLDQTTSSQKLTFAVVVLSYTILFVFLRAKLSHQNYKLRAQYQKVFGHPLKDKFSHTLILFVLAIAKASIWPLWYGFTALGIFWLWPHATSGDLPSLIIAGALGLFVLELIHGLSAKGGVLALHLSWPAGICAYLYSESRRLRWPFILILLGLYTSELISGEQEAEASRLLFLLLLVGMTYIYAFLLKRERLPAALPAPLQQGLPLLLLQGLLVGSFLAIMVMAVLGLYLAAWLLLTYQQLTLFIMLAALLVYQMGERWLKLEHRQLNYQRLLARRKELIAQQRVQAEEPSEEAALREVLPEIVEQCLDTEQISEQSLTLLKGLSLIGFVIAILTLWSNALEMTSWLDQIVVWQVSEVGETGIVMVDITLQSLLYALIVVVVTVIAIRNLPGILELLVLRRFELAPGTGYAITTVIRYVLLMAGVLVTCTIIGFQWSSLQWLVAAFGVGLGFGLQEIFANFISGLIILFERPIRIGDIVTINDLSGKISQIKTRATTIIDWDNKEIVVPNKAFITEKLVNWSLTDPITRIVIPVGVAYGSDIEKVEKLLYQVADEHPLVLKDPPPSVYFLAFGSSSLDFQLRVYITAIDHRLPTIHRINKSIDSLFRQHNIEIAFPQMDIHVRDVAEGRENRPDD